ncbi:MAG: VPLPA-CTERM sorting domain-containing protein [Rhodobacteraceae bacterium]|jgi:hypothetical protein|nr:VPLPA-CTERM sorting domain-containing protein [Paracoccaceae bacterium]
MKLLSVAALIATLVTGAAQAATLTGTFGITVYNYNSDGNAANAHASSAVLANIATRTNVISDSFTYTGALNFAVTAAQDAPTTIGQWLATAGGTVSGLDSTVANRQLSLSGYRATSFFVITAAFANGFNATIRHDDGISVFDDGAQIATFAQPTTARTTIANGFDGGAWSLFYVAANGNPSILQVEADQQPTPVPVPAALPLLAAGLGALAFFRRRAARA